MLKKTLRLLAILLALTLSTSPLYAWADAAQAQQAAEKEVFTDIPAGVGDFESAIYRMRDLGVIYGVGNGRFGYGLPVTRGQFAAFIVRMMGWEKVTPQTPSFTDNTNQASNYFYSDIETALANGAILKDTELYRPNEPITRSEIAVMLVRALGYDSLARQQLSSLASPYTDVAQNSAYLAMASDFGIIAGDGKGHFLPDATATREQAAAMLARMYDKLHTPLSELHGFYAISSYSQVDKLAYLNSVGFGWSRLEYDTLTGTVNLNQSRAGNNEYGIPTGYTEPYTLAAQAGAARQLMVFVKDEAVTDALSGSKPLVRYILEDPAVRTQVATQIVTRLLSGPESAPELTFDGVVIDFETLSGTSSKEALNAFLTELRSLLDVAGKTLTVAVHPIRRPGLAAYDGYDFRTIGNLADRVILMAHDYYAKGLTETEMNQGYTLTPLTPIDDIYYALKGITDSTTGVQDRSKILLQFSFDSVQWKLKDGKVTNAKGLYMPYSQILTLLSGDSSIGFWSEMNQSPSLRFYDESDQTDNVVWYEDSRSIEAKLKLAGLFGVKGVSLWRLGLIPDYEETSESSHNLDIWQTFLTHRVVQNMESTSAPE